MATITPTITRINQDGSRSYVVKWETLTENDTAAAVEILARADRSFQVIGSFGGGNVSLQGSNDGVTYGILEDLSATAITFTAADIQGVGPITRYMRPSTPSGTAVDVDCFLFVTGGVVR